MIAEGDPFTLIEGMTIAAHAVGASEGYVYVRSEYPHAIAALRRAIEAAYTHGFLGQDVLGSGLAFDLHVRVGAGAYICGEESSMLESLEGHRGEVRAKPPIPAIKGLWGRPTVVNNVLTLCAVPMVLADGGEAYAELGTGRSRGTQVFQLAGNIKQGGIVELPFGVTPARARRGLRRRHAVRAPGARRAGRRPARRLPAGDPASTSPWTTRRSPRPARCSGTAASWSSTTPSTWRGWRGSRWSSARGVLRQVHALPGRLDARRGDDRPDRRGRGPGGQPGAARRPLRDHDEGSLCAMGGLTPMPVRSALKHFPRGLRAGRKPRREHPYDQHLGSGGRLRHARGPASAETVR